MRARVCPHRLWQPRTAYPLHPMIPPRPAPHIGPYMSCCHAAVEARPVVPPQHGGGDPWVSTGFAVRPPRRCVFMNWLSMLATLSSPQDTVTHTHTHTYTRAPRAIINAGTPTVPPSHPHPPTGFVCRPTYFIERLLNPPYILSTTTNTMVFLPLSEPTISPLDPWHATVQSQMAEDAALAAELQRQENAAARTAEARMRSSQSVAAHGHQNPSAHDHQLGDARLHRPPVTGGDRRPGQTDAKSSKDGGCHVM